MSEKNNEKNDFKSRLSEYIEHYDDNLKLYVIVKYFEEKLYNLPSDFDIVDAKTFYKLIKETYDELDCKTWAQYEKEIKFKRIFYDKFIKKYFNAYEKEKILKYCYDNISLNKNDKPILDKDFFAAVLDSIFENEIYYQNNNDYISYHIMWNKSLLKEIPKYQDKKKIDYDLIHDLLLKNYNLFPNDFDILPNDSFKEIIDKSVDDFNIFPIQEWKIMAHLIINFYDEYNKEKNKFSNKNEHYNIKPLLNSYIYSSTHYNILDCIHDELLKLPEDFDIVDVDSFCKSVDETYDELGCYYWEKNEIEEKSQELFYDKFIEKFNKAYNEEKLIKYCYNCLKENANCKQNPNKKDFEIVLKSLFKKYKSNKNISNIFKVILDNYELFPNDFNIVPTKRLEKIVEYIIEKYKNNENIFKWKILINFMFVFNDEYKFRKKTINSNKERKELENARILFEKYKIHLSALLLDETDKADKYNPALIEKIKFKYKNKMEKADRLYDAVSSLYENLDDFKDTDPYIAFIAIENTTSMKDYNIMSFDNINEAFKNELKKSKDNNYTTPEIISKFRKQTPEMLEKTIKRNEQIAKEQFYKEQKEANDKIDEENNKKIEEHKEKIEKCRNRITELTSKASEIQLEITSLKKELEELNDLQINLKLKFVNEEMMFNWCEDDFEIKNEYINHLNEYDLSAIRWNNVKVSGIDFSITNAELNPQEVYKKDISNCKFKDANLRDLNINYVGVDLRGTDIREEISMPGVEYSIYDENTKFSNEIINYLTSLGKYDYNNKNKSL